MATIDVLLPVRNGIAFLAESLDSVRAQRFADWRMLVLDHGSTDGSRELAERYNAQDRRIEVHSFPQADGLAGLLNHGLDITDCRYVMRHDADDVCYPDRMDIVLEAFAAQPGVAAVGGQADVIDGAGAPIGDMKMPIGVKRVSVAGLFCNPIAHPAAMLDFAQMQARGVRYGADFLQALPPGQSLRVQGLAEDYFMFGQLAIEGKCTNVPQRLIKYRRHGNNVGATKFQAQMDMSLQVSRFLARSLCAAHGLPYVDPAPFCNHGGMLFDVGGGSDFSAQFAQMARNLRRVFGDSQEVERELAFRKAVSTRRELLLLWRYFRFQSRNAPENGEWNAIRSWLVGRFPGKSRIHVAAEAAV
jgi:hypothetical protein